MPVELKQCKYVRLAEQPSDQPQAVCEFTGHSLNRQDNNSVEVIKPCPFIEANLRNSQCQIINYDYPIEKFIRRIRRQFLVN